MLSWSRCSRIKSAICVLGGDLCIAKSGWSSTTRPRSGISAIPVAPLPVSCDVVESRDGQPDGRTKAPWSSPGTGMAIRPRVVTSAKLRYSTTDRSSLARCDGRGTGCAAHACELTRDAGAWASRAIIKIAKSHCDDLGSYTLRGSWYAADSQLGCCAARTARCVEEFELNSIDRAVRCHLPHRPSGVSRGRVLVLGSQAKLSPHEC